MEERSENASGTVSSNVRNIFEPPSRWYSKDEHAYAQRRAKITSLRLLSILRRSHSTVPAHARPRVHLTKAPLIHPCHHNHRERLSPFSVNCDNVSRNGGTATNAPSTALTPPSYRIQGMADPSNSISIDASP
jgi:hypothetical protein